MDISGVVVGPGGQGTSERHSAAPPLGRAAGSARATVDEAFRQHGPYVFRLLRRLGVADADVDDACQEVFVAVHRSLPSFEGRARLRTWIYTIATRQAADYRRRTRNNRSRAEAVRELAAVANATAEDPQRLLERTRARALLDELLDTLDDDKRQVFVLYEIEELPMREVIEIVGCPLQTGYSRLHAARKQLKQAAKRRGLSR